MNIQQHELLSITVFKSDSLHRVVVELRHGAQYLRQSSCVGRDDQKHGCQ
ncbi:hypothetical protein PC119_g26551 [Phytophthora cactorum]|nr:hypothetical protein PC119_g26551 [Phytophthora cactorum]KAG3120107.1 hypothetical protein C6341_g27367 [Phytophthora cactorum]KAG4036555.1 hypothetical protein PC123_g27876 [Phytophthora cactorum]